MALASQVRVGVLSHIGPERFYAIDGDRIEVVTFAFSGKDAPFGGVAPLVHENDDSISRTIGNATPRDDRTAPTAWADAIAFTSPNTVQHGARASTAR